MIRRLHAIATAIATGAVLALGLVSAPADDAHASNGEIVRSADFVERVNESIDRGATWLRRQQRPDGSFRVSYSAYEASGTALAYLTLRVCGVPRDDESMKRAYDSLRQEYVNARDSDRLRTYTAALIMMAIEEHGRGGPQLMAKPRSSGDDTERTTHLDEPDLAWMEELVRFLEGNQATNGGWRYGRRVSRYTGRSGRNESGDYDHSNTQYALLGLKAASRSGVAVDPRVYAKTLRHLIDAQQRTGPSVPRVAFVGRRGTFAREKDRARGWSYMSLGTTQGRRRTPQGLGGAYGSMTAGSLGALVICRSELIGWSDYTRRLDADTEEAIWDGIAWLGRNFAVDQNPGMGGWHLYYLYALERAGVLAGVDWMGEHDWYGEGADYLLRTQQRGGSWTADGDESVSTCFALLFLKKGTIPVSRGAVTPSGAVDNIDFDAARVLRGKDLDDFVDLVISRWARAKSDVDRAALRRGTAAVGPKVILPLLRQMGAGNGRQRAPAHALLSAVTRQTLKFDPDAAAEARFDALLPWEEWYMAHATRLAFDERSGTLVTR